MQKQKTADDKTPVVKGADSKPVPNEKAGIAAQEARSFLAAQKAKDEEDSKRKSRRGCCGCC